MQGNSVGPEHNAILATADIARRGAREPDHAAENRALRMLATELENPDGDVLSRLCACAMELCAAHSAGVSLVEMDGFETVFRWYGIAGRWEKYRGGSMPRDASPCGTVLDRNETLLMDRPGQYYPRVAEADPAPMEALLAPFHLLGQPVGTVWVLAHDGTRHFDAEDVRLVESLARVAAAAYLARSEIRLALEARDEALRANDRLRRTNARLADKLDPT